MSRFPLCAVAALFALGGQAQAAGCTPVKSDVVSLGEKAARFYSERSLGDVIAAEKRRIEAMGTAAGPITKSMKCEPFPNLLGADEWRCVGAGKVCAK
jgi:hypothetical protein